MNSFNSDSGGSGTSGDSSSALQEQLTRNLQQFSQNVSTLQQRQVSNARRGAERSFDNSSEEASTRALVTNTQQLATLIKDQLCSFQPSGATATQLQKSTHSRFLNKFSELLNTFQVVQRQLTTAERERVREIKKSSAAGFHHLGEPQEDREQFELDNRRHQDQVVVDTQSNEELLEREQSIRQLESDISTINHIFTELATMVYEQGETVDSIEAHIESSSIQVHSATQQLQSAYTYQTRARRKQCILFTVLAVILVVVILIIYYT